ncbi:unannotated protein [freshwater metagenome]|jgi:hypothetical protein|uniref:Unannotated protein n=1 Tax=freshwater metagenome TaxID=449393 RepID=A0A6J7JAG9_9ZZZZ|nr:hypothetical protein [Actinomycetota bacterium]MSV62530.1 hypothetical protein [Actinomycetota bacterium]MSV78431.1 hypothetical protein [Actinomycetota bacterium]MSW15888.1 hypothetical protein [Actinomycetota bacterium]MSX44428.1 hypothetical protein [Actinomycetota bacterium]
MSEKNFLSWVGFKGEDKTLTTSTSASAPTTNAIERIRELESQLNDLRSRRDITALSKEEFEILATETAMSIIKTAQQREAKASTTAEKVLSESQRSARSALEAAEAKAKATLSQAESRGRKYIEAAESDASDLISNAENEAEELISTKKREGSTITSSAKRDADRLVLEATTEVAEYRQWLSGVITEAERLYRIQTQSLDAAESAIAQSRNRLESAFTRLAELQKSVQAAINPDGTPQGDAKVQARISIVRDGNSQISKPVVKKVTKRVAASKTRKKAVKKKR